MPHSVAMWAKDRAAGVTGLTVKDEAGGKSWIGGRIGIGNVAPEATLHTTGEGATSATTNILVKNSGGTELLKVTNDGAISGSVGPFSGSFVGDGSGLTGIAADTYDLNATTDGSNVDINLTSTSGTDNSVVQLTAGSNITLTRNSSAEVTIASSGGGDTGVSAATKVFVWFNGMT